MNKFFLFLCSFGILTGAPAPAQASIWEFFFPSLRQYEEDPSTTLQAPFAVDEQGDKIVVPDEEKKEDLSVSHRLTANLGEWLGPVVAQAMTFESANYQDDLKETEPYFTPSARAAYLKFLQDKKVIKILESNRFYVRSIVEDTPVVLVEKPLDGRYRWLYEVPVLVTYMPYDLKDYKQGDATTQHMKLNIQIGRHEVAPEHGVLIEQWDGTIEKTNAAQKKTP